jgi:hypothetical protein
MEFGVFTISAAFFAIVVLGLLKLWSDERKGRLDERKGRLDERKGRLDERKGRLDERKGREAERKGREAERKGREAERQKRMRSEFRDKADTFTDREEVFSHLREANFSSSQAKAELPDQGTADFFSESSSQPSVGGNIKLSSFDRSKVKGTTPKLEAFHWNVDRLEIHKILLRKVFLDKEVFLKNKSCFYHLHITSSGS